MYVKWIGIGFVLVVAMKLGVTCVSAINTLGMVGAIGWEHQLTRIGMLGAIALHMT